MIRIDQLPSRLTNTDTFRAHGAARNITEIHVNDSKGFYQENPVETYRNKRLHAHIAYKYKTSKAKVDILPLT